ncbi:MAG: hypothetical protein ABIP79_07465 [Chitinophagaceae bacterium]
MLQNVDTSTSSVEFMQQKSDSLLFFHWKNKREQIKDCNRRRYEKLKLGTK